MAFTFNWATNANAFGGRQALSSSQRCERTLPSMRRSAGSTPGAISIGTYQVTVPVCSSSGRPGAPLAEGWVRISTSPLVPAPAFAVNVTARSNPGSTRRATAS